MGKPLSTTSSRRRSNPKPKSPHATRPTPTGVGRAAVEPAVSEGLGSGAKRFQELPPTSAEAQLPADRWTTSILIFAVVGIPLAILPAWFEMYDTTPKLAVAYVSAALLLWFPGRYWSGVAALRRDRYGCAFYGLLMLGMVSLVISATMSSDASLSFAGTVWRRLGVGSQAIVLLIVGVIAAYVFLYRQAAKRLMLGMETAAGLASFYAILQYFGLDPLIPRSFYTFGSSAAVRPPATLTQATYFATFLLPAILIAAGLRLSETRPPWKRMHELMLLLSLSALFLSGTRSALLGLGVALCALAYFERCRLRSRRVLLRVAYASLACAVAAALFLLTPAGRPARARIAQWTADRTGGPRLLVWRDSLPLIWQHPVVGIGPELFEAEFRKTESLELARAFPDAYHESPHNFFLEIATAQGMIGLSFWISLLALAGICGLLAYHAKDPNAGILLPALLAMLVSLQFCPLTITNELYLLALAAILIGLLPNQPPSGAVSTPVVARYTNVFSVALFFLAAAYVAQASICTFVERRAARGDFATAGRWYGVVRELPMPAPNLELSRQIASAVPRFAVPIRREALAMAQQAADAAEVGSAERFNALYQSAMLAMMSRDLPRAERKLRSAIDASPTWYRPRMALASVLWWEGRNPEAESEAARALDCAGRVEPNAKRTLDSARAQASAVAALRGRGSRR
ncbi:MAG: O-antigen ligase family protein [Bryobacteraceae bacterium]